MSDLGEYGLVLRERIHNAWIVCVLQFDIAEIKAVIRIKLWRLVVRCRFSDLTDTQ